MMLTVQIDTVNQHGPGLWKVALACLVAMAFYDLLMQTLGRLEDSWRSWKARHHDDPIDDLPERHDDDDLSCALCGCTNDRPCAGGCYWIRRDPAVCSRCAPATEPPKAGWTPEPPDTVAGALAKLSREGYLHHRGLE